MNHLYFATNEETRYQHAQNQLQHTAPHVLLDRLDVVIPEIQAGDPATVIQQKVDFVRGQTTKPFLVESTSSDTAPRPGHGDDKVKAIAQVALAYLDDVYRFGGLDEFAQWLQDQANGIDSQRRTISQRWTSRSSGWKNMIEDPDSYVNFEQNYARVNAMIRRFGPQASGNALEIGCGTGEAGRILKESNPGLQLLSTDISPGMLAEAQKQTREAGLDISYQEADITKTDLGADRYGMILSRGVVISHLPRGSVYDFLESITRLSREGSYFLFDFMQSEKVGDVEKPVDSKNEFTLGQLDALLGELGWNRVDDDGDDTMRVRVACYQKRETM
jgi:SAM-dependent methyltransferase